MSIFKCKMCGGTIEFEPGASVGVCDHCGTKQTLPRLGDDRRANLYDRANHFRRNNEFDKAAGIYEQILTEDTTDAEAYWSLVLCQYGIEYVEDPTTHKRVPTVNRAQFTSIFDDDNYKSALANADGYQRALYQEEANAINEIQKGILAISQREEPFDVFICYKETDAQGRRTPDSVLANDLYHQLVQEGFKVFFSRITLEDKLGTAYEPYIFAALNSSKVMVVLGTKPEHFNAVWVKNEWSRYLSLVKESGGQKVLIPAYKDMDPYDLPEEFSHLQAQDMSKLGFMQDLIRGIKKMIRTDEAKQVQTVVKETVVTGGAVGTAPILKRAFMFLEDGEWEKADSFCEQALNQNPEEAQAYLGKLMAELQLHRKEDLPKQEQAFDRNDHYQKAVRFATGEMKHFLVDAKERFYARRGDEIYDQAMELFESDSVKNVQNAQAMFESIADWRDAQSYASRCEERIVDLKELAVQEKKRIRRTIILVWVAVVLIVYFIVHLSVIAPILTYNKAVSLCESGEYELAKEKFLSLSDYKDSRVQVRNCEYGIKYDYVKDYYNNSNETTYEYLTELKEANYKDSADLYDELYKWKATLVYFNTDENDTSTILESVNTHGDYLHFGFRLEGGAPGEVVTVYSTTFWDGELYDGGSEWEDCKKGTTIYGEWNEGYGCSPGTRSEYIYVQGIDEPIGYDSIKYVFMDFNNQ